MTTVGKILVFVNLLFSLAVGTLVVFAYTARTHWVSEYNKLKDYYAVSKANADTYAAEVKRIEQDRDNQVAQARKERQGLQDKLTLATNQNKTLADDLDKERAKTAQTDAIVKAAQQDVAKRQADVDRMKETLTAETKKNNDLVKLNNDYRAEMVAAQLQAQGFKDRNKQLEGQVQELAKDLTRIRANLASGGSGAVRGAKNPPPENVEGLIKATDPGSGLVTITIGSDAGLSKGNTLEVFRLADVPSQSKYLGTIRIRNVTPSEAVGELVSRPSAPLQKGDIVASHIQ